MKRKNNRKRWRPPQEGDEGALVSYYHKLKRTYEDTELNEWVNGKRVKHWKMVYAYGNQGGKYIPIFYKNQRYWKRKVFREKTVEWIVGIIIGIVAILIYIYVLK